MHLTNYSINKHSTTFDSSEAVDQGSKRTIQFLNRWLAENGYCVGEMWAKIHVSNFVCLSVCLIVLTFIRILSSRQL